MNLGLHYLSGSITFDAVVTKVSPLLASQIVWLDSLLMNVDRTVRNTNMLMWNKELWLIDQGAALYFHHAWQNLDEQGTRAFPQIKDHVLLPLATELDAVDTMFKTILRDDIFQSIVSLIPNEWLVDESSSESPNAKRAVYIKFLQTRLTISATFVKEAKHAREALI